MGEAARKLKSVPGPEFRDASQSTNVPSAEYQMSAAGQLYLNSAPEAYIQCREGGHSFPKQRLQDLRFDKDGAGYDVVSTECVNCHAVAKVERWIIREAADGTVIDMRRHDSQIHYFRLADDEPKYLLPPGSGRILPRGQVRELHVASHFVGRKVRRLGRRSQGGTG